MNAKKGCGSEDDGGRREGGREIDDVYMLLRVRYWDRMARRGEGVSPSHTMSEAPSPSQARRTDCMGRERGKRERRERVSQEAPFLALQINRSSSSFSHSLFHSLSLTLVQPRGMCGRVRRCVHLSRWPRSPNNAEMTSAIHPFHNPVRAEEGRVSLLSLSLFLFLFVFLFFFLDARKHYCFL
jgi:hypothetical protein